MHSSREINFFAVIYLQMLKLIGFKQQHCAISNYQGMIWMEKVW
jgi:hypothetical protein